MFDAVVYRDWFFAANCVGDVNRGSLAGVCHFGPVDASLNDWDGVNGLVISFDADAVGGGEHVRFFAWKRDVRSPDLDDDVPWVLEAGMIDCDGDDVVVRFHRGFNRFFEGEFDERLVEQAIDGFVDGFVVASSPVS